MITAWGRTYLMAAALGVRAIQTDWYVALCWTAPEPLATGDTIPEIPFLRNYARALLPGSTLTVTADTVVNGTDIFFNSNNDPKDWQSASHFAICTAALGGDLLGWERLTAPVIVPTDNAPYFRAGAISFTLADF